MQASSFLGEVVVHINFWLYSDFRVSVRVALYVHSYLRITIPTYKLTLLYKCREVHCMTCTFILLCGYFEKPILIPTYKLTLLYKCIVL